MYLLNLAEAKAAFLAMAVILFVIPVWISIVAFSRKKGKGENLNTMNEEETTT